MTSNNITKTAWSDLPNAKYIDLILADLKANPYKWTYGSDSFKAADGHAWRVANGAAWEAAQTIANMYKMVDNEPTAMRSAPAGGAIFALITHADFGSLLDEKPEDVQTIALLGNPAAILLYPACLALNKSKEIAW